MKRIIIILSFLIPLITYSTIAYAATKISERNVEKRLALVIGNGNYLHSILANPENDARAIEDALKKLGFEVLKFENLSQAQMKKAIDEFGLKLKNYDVGLFFYAGHGIQSKGFNYLIPVDADLQTEAQVEYDCVQADRVLSLMEESGAKVKIVILDACRNNPFERSWTRSNSTRGLATMNAPSGTLIAYSTSPGSTAADGSGENSPYTAAILENISAPDIPILQMFQNVRSTVSEKSSKQQIPWESTSLTGDFFFNPNSEFQVSTVGIQPGNNTHYLDKSVIPKDNRNSIKIREIIEKPVTKMRSGIAVQDTTYYALIDNGRDVKIKKGTTLAIYRPTSSISTISGANIESNPKKIGIIRILNTYEQGSEGELALYSNQSIDYLKEPHFLKVKNITSTLYFTVRPNYYNLRRWDGSGDFISSKGIGTPGVSIGYMAYSKTIGGYIEGAFLNPSQEFYLIFIGVVKPLIKSFALKAGLGTDDTMRGFGIDVGGFNYFKRASLIYSVTSASWYSWDEHDTLGYLGISLGFAYNF